VFYQYYVGDIGEDFERTRLESSRGVEFDIEDESGSAIVDPSGAVVVFDDDFVVQTKDPGVRRREAVLAAGTKVAVLGIARLEPDTNPTADASSFRQRPLRPRFSAASSTLIISDRADLAS
jgi:hypothetical protein